MSEMVNTQRKSTRLKAKPRINYRRAADEGLYTQELEEEITNGLSQSIQNVSQTRRPLIESTNLSRNSNPQATSVDLPRKVNCLKRVPKASRINAAKVLTELVN